MRAVFSLSILVLLVSAFSISAAGNLLVLNKQAIAFQPPSDCSGNLALEASMACAAKNSVLASDGLRLDVHVGSDFVQKLSGANTRLTWFTGEGPVISDALSFPLTGEGFSVIHFDGRQLHVYASTSDTEAAAALGQYLFDERKNLAFNKDCRLSVSSNGDAIAFKKCVPTNLPTKSSFQTQSLGSQAYDDFFVYDAAQGGVSAGALPELGDCSKVAFSKWPTPSKEVIDKFNVAGLGGYDSGHRTHKGIDISIAENDPVYSVLPGKILDIYSACPAYSTPADYGCGGGFGNLVKVVHGTCTYDGQKSYFMTQYNHLAKAADGLKIGDGVAAGQKIALGGSSGRSTGPHLHFGAALIDSLKTGQSTDSDSNVVLNPSPALTVASLPAGSVPGPVQARPQSILDFAEEGKIKTSVKNGETGILAITPSVNGQCSQPPQTPYLLGQAQELSSPICVYYQLSAEHAAAVQDIAFAGYSERSGSYFTVRSAIPKDSSIQYPEDYESQVNIGKPLSASGQPSAGVAVAALPVLKPGDSYPGGLHLNMYLRTELISPSTEVSANAKAPGISRVKVGEINVGLLKSNYIKNVPGSLQGKTFVIDPGHGGPDGLGSYVGADEKTTPRHERTITLAVSKELRELLSGAGAKVVMTRETDVDVDLSDRADLADSQNADAFVSVHVNCDREKAIRETQGITQFAGIKKTDPELCSAGVIYPKVGGAQEKNSIGLAQAIAKSMSLDSLPSFGVYFDGPGSTFVGTYYAGKIYKPTPLGVLRGTTKTAVLVEMGPIDDDRLDDSNYQQQLAQQIYGGILQKFGTSSTPTSGAFNVQLHACTQGQVNNGDYSLTFEELDPLITEASQKYGVEKALIKAIISQESGRRPCVISFYKDCCFGLMQLNRLNGDETGYSLATSTAGVLQQQTGFACFDKPLDPRNNIMCGAKHLADLVRFYGNKYPGQDSIKIVAAAYNAGGGNVEKYGGVPPFGETQNYVVEVRKFYDQYRTA
ncbi:N-acetylmuramoyl-L-alanine amidase [Candidatus Micrarchaeota archaeon]|nr:N-acetylmuramoyl-L-alanine amidase [Candidatus Micrarchaeota archaeon]